ncbi:hypothetical protein L7F22_053662 [Adiantum nelumboides]|nr:hypothetical protein [Adiantum nelumboides]
MQPHGFVKKGQEDKVCKCHKALYGLKQSPRAWYEKVDTHLVKRGFCNSPTKSTLYVKHEGDVLLIVVLYADDLLITGPNGGHIAEFKVDLNATFKVKVLGLLHHYLGIPFKQCDGGIALCQEGYIETLLCKFGLEDCKPIATPMETGLKLSLHDAGDLADVTLYQTAVGCLIYVCNTRPDIQFAISQDTANTIYTDSQSALAVVRKPVLHARTKHIEVHYHYVRERLSAEEISFTYVPTQDNLADLFTKALSHEKLETFRKALGFLPFVD